MKTNEQLSRELSIRAAKKLMLLKETFNRMLNNQPMKEDDYEME